MPRSERAYFERRFGWSLENVRTRGNRYVQRIVSLSRNGPEPAEVDQDIEQTIQSKRGGGHAMDSGVRQQMESGFGRDFSGVRVHTDSDADALNKNLNARAFITGSDIFFRGGEYRPGNSSGRELLAHELTRVVQQGGGGKVQRLCAECEEEQASEGVAGIQTKLSLGQPHDRYEQKADSVAQQIIRQEHSGPSKNRGDGGHKDIQTKTAWTNPGQQNHGNEQSGNSAPTNNDVSQQYLMRQEDEEPEEVQFKPVVQLQIKGEEEDEAPLKAKSVGSVMQKSGVVQKSASQVNRVSPMAERIAKKYITNAGLAPQGLLQLSPLSDEFAALWQAGNKGVFFERLRNMGASDPYVYDFITNNLSGDDL